MKKTLIALMLAVTTLTAFNAHAIPPVPPSIADLATENVVCMDLNALTTEEIDYIERHPDSIITVALDIRQACIDFSLDNKPADK